MDKIYSVNSIYELFELRAEERGYRKGVRKMLKICISLRFPQISQTTMNNILAIPDVKILESIFTVACTSNSLDDFQRDIRGIAPIN